MSDLSRLRARWIRLESRIAKLEQQELDSTDDHEILELTEKRLEAETRLALTIRQTHAEEKRLATDPNSKLRFTGV